jgi:hypothetical protein
MVTRAVRCTTFRGELDGDVFTASNPPVLTCWDDEEITVVDEVMTMQELVNEARENPRALAALLSVEVSR